MTLTRKDNVVELGHLATRELVPNSCKQDDVDIEDTSTCQPASHVIKEIDPIDAYYQEISLFCLKKESRPRKWAIKLTLSEHFDKVTMLVIMLNCFTLGLYDPFDKECKTLKCQILEVLENVIFVYFLLEMLIKILAFGLLGRQGYFSETWNRLDFFIVMAGLFEQVYGDGEFLSSVRLVRVLRPLRAINRVPSIRILVTLLMDTLPMLGNVCVLCVLTLMVFAIVGVQLWQGLLRNRCSLRLPNNITGFNATALNLPTYYQGDEEWSVICSRTYDHGAVKCTNDIIPRYRENEIECTLSYAQFQNSSFVPSLLANSTNDPPCINWNGYYSVCEPVGLNPFYEAISFDNTGEAFVGIFQVVTLEGWTDIMYIMQDVYSPWVWLYFVALVFVGNYFLTNLCLVVVATQFSETREREQALIEAAVNRSKKSFTSSLGSSENNSQKGCYNQMLDFVARACRRVARRIKKKVMGAAKSRNKEVLETKALKKKKSRPKGDGAIHFHHHHHHHIHHHHLHLCRHPCTSHIRHLTQTSNDYQSNAAVPATLTVHPLGFNQATFLIPSTKVVICHGGPLLHEIGQPPVATLSLFPSALAAAYRASPIQNAQDRYSDFANSEEFHLRNGDDCEECARMLVPPSYESAEWQWETETEDDDNANLELLPKELCCLKNVRFAVKSVCESKYFKLVIMISIFGNTVAMACEHHLQPQLMTAILDVVNTIFTGLFTLEFIMKLLAYGPYGYIKEAFNLFDGTIVIISLVELSGDQGSGVSVLRTFRLLRIFKLVRFLPALQKQIKVMLQTLDNVMTFLGLLLIFLFTSAILGMHLFGAKMVEDGESVRHSFDNLMWSLITVFQVLTEEDWNAVLYDAMRFTSPWASVYFIVLMIIGNYVLFNLLVAILVEGFATDTDNDESLNEVPTVRASDDGNNHALKLELPGTFSASMTRSMVSDGRISKSMPDISFSGTCSDQCGIEKKDGAACVPIQHKLEKPSVSDPALYSRSISTDKTKPTANAHLVVVERSVDCKCHGITFFESRINWTCFFLSPGNVFRKACLKLVSYAWFDNVVLLFIFANCIIMAIERPSIHPESTERKIIDYSNNIFAVAFTIEMFIKIAAWGFFFGPGTYLRSGWNRLDFALVVLSLVDILVDHVLKSKSSILGMLKVLRAFRTLRPLRLISRAPGLKIVVETLLQSLAPIGNLCVVGSVFFIIFGILGVQLFKGKFYYCEGASKPIHTKDQCLSLGGTWLNKRNNFDTLPKAILTLFVFSTGDSWVSLMYDGIDAVGVDKQPMRNHNPWSFLYFVGFLLVAGFVVINMVVGVIIDNFQKCQAQIMASMEQDTDVHVTNCDDEDDYSSPSPRPRNRSILINKESAESGLPQTCPNSNSLNSSNQARTVTILDQSDRNGSRACDFVPNEQVRQARRRSPKQNASKYEIPADLESFSYPRRLIYSFVSHFKFDLAIAAVIGVNVLLMAIEHYHMPQVLVKLLKYMNFLFTAIFVLEAILKIIGFGPKLFFSQRWNQLDVVIVFLSIIGIVFEELNSSLPINPTIIRVMRILRIARVLKILKAADGVQSLLNCVTDALPQVGNLASLFLLIFFIYSALGIELYGKLDCSRGVCEGLDRHAHFENFGYAMLTLFRISTGDNWSGVFKDCLNPNLCPADCSMLAYISPVYFATFVMASQFVLVNVVVAVLMKQLEESKNVALMPSSLTSKLRSRTSSTSKDIPSKLGSINQEHGLKWSTANLKPNSQDTSQKLNSSISQELSKQSTPRINQRSSSLGGLRDSLSDDLNILTSANSGTSFVDKSGFYIRDYGLGDSMVKICNNLCRCETCGYTVQTHPEEKALGRVHERDHWSPSKRSGEASPDACRFSPSIHVPTPACSCLYEANHSEHKQIYDRKPLLSFESINLPSEGEDPINRSVANTNPLISDVIADEKATDGSASEAYAETHVCAAVKSYKPSELNLRRMFDVGSDNNSYGFGVRSHEVLEIGQKHLSSNLKASSLQDYPCFDNRKSHSNCSISPFKLVNNLECIENETIVASCRVADVALGDLSPAALPLQVGCEQSTEDLEAEGSAEPTEGAFKHEPNKHEPQENDTITLV